MIISRDSWESFGGQTPPRGVFLDGALATVACQFLEKTPATTVVTWREESGTEEYRQVLDLTQLAEHRIDHSVTFILNPDNKWSVEYDTEKLW